MKLSSFRELFLFLLSDIYAVENQLLVDLPLMVKKAHSQALKDAIQQHLEETKNQVKRLEKIFKITNDKPVKTEWNTDAKHIFSGIENFIKNNPSSSLVDAAIIVIAQRIEHFEIATYGTLAEFAHVLHNGEVKSLCDETLKEEIRADTTLTKLAKGGLFTSGINAEATHSL